LLSLRPDLFKKEVIIMAIFKVKLEIKVVPMAMVILLFIMAMVIYLIKRYFINVMEEILSSLDFYKHHFFQISIFLHIS
jgi:hypothetical protein